MSNFTKATIFSERPVSSTELAKNYDMHRRMSIATPPESLSSSMDKSLDVIDTTLDGFLVDVKEELEKFEERFYEPTVGAIMDTSKATSGDLYRLRDDLMDTTTAARP